MAIFGSFARKQHNNESDLDLIVEFHGKIGIQFIDLADEIENIIGFKVDLVSRKGIKDKYYKSISADLIYV
jgi:predicted nucleotidyltransferase